MIPVSISTGAVSNRAFDLGLLPPGTVAAPPTSNWSTLDNVAMEAVTVCLEAERDFQTAVTSWLQACNLHRIEDVSVHIQATASARLMSDRMYWTEQGSDRQTRFFTAHAYYIMRDGSSDIAELVDLCRREIDNALTLLWPGAPHPKPPAAPLLDPDAVTAAIEPAALETLPKWITMPAADLLQILEPAEPGTFDPEEDAQEWLFVAPFFQLQMHSRAIKELWQETAAIAQHPGLKQWWRENGHYTALVTAAQVEPAGPHEKRTDWHDTYLTTGERVLLDSEGFVDDYVDIWSPAAFAEWQVPASAVDSPEAWREALAEFLRQTAAKLDMPPPPAEALIPKPHTATDAAKSAPAESGVTPGQDLPDLPSYTTPPDGAMEYSLRPDSDTTTIYAVVDGYTFAVDLPTDVAQQPARRGEAADDVAVCEGSVMLDMPRERTTFQFVVVPEDEAVDQGTDTAFTVIDWWGDEGFFIEDEPEDDEEFMIRHVDDEDEPYEYRGLRRMKPDNGYVFVAMWNYPADTPAIDQERFDHTLTTMRVTAATADELTAERFTPRVIPQYDIAGNIIND